MIDLHTHSTASDGFLHPSELIEQASALKLEAIALTDHDSVAGVEEALQTAATVKNKIEVVRGAELSVYYPHADMEILALDIPTTALGDFTSYQTEVFAKREGMVYRRLELLQKAGYDIRYEDIAYDKNGKLRTQIRRPHFADVLLQKGYIKDTKTAYQDIFAKGGVAYVENRPLAAEKVITFIKETGAKAFMAHPIHTGFAPQRLFEVLKQLQKAGLDGIEVFHASQEPAFRKTCLELITELGLKTSGGSDFHGGTAHPENKLGTGKNHNLNMPKWILDELKSPTPASAGYYKELEKII